MKRLAILAFMLLVVSQGVMAKESKGHREKSKSPFIREIK